MADLTSVQLGSLSTYVYGLQDIPQVEDLNELIYGDVRNISDIWISFFTKIDSIIITRLVFPACCDTFNNAFTVFQSKVRFALFHK